MAAGRAYSLWGRNGAGKTTLIRLIAGLLAPDQGRVEVLGRDPAHDWRIRREIGLVEDQDSCFPELTAEEFLWWVGRLRGLGEDACEEEIRVLAGKFYLQERISDQVSCLSYGMRRKTLLASAFVAAPKVVLIDEPTTGVDVDSLESLIGLLEEHQRRGGVAVIACHDRGFRDRVCSDVIELEGGRLVAQGPAR